MEPWSRLREHLRAQGTAPSTTRFLLLLCYQFPRLDLKNQVCQEMFGKSCKYTLLVASAFEETTFLLVKLSITWPVKSAKAVGGDGSVSMHWNLKKKNRPEDVNE